MQFNAEDILNEWEHNAISIDMFAEFLPLVVRPDNVDKIMTKIWSWGNIPLIQVIEEESRLGLDALATVDPEAGRRPGFQLIQDWFRKNHPR